MPRQHVWTTRESDGCKREVRATRFAREWKLQAKRADASEWTYYDRPLKEDMVALQELIERKYRRRRATADDVTSVEKLMREQSQEE